MGSLKQIYPHQQLTYGVSAPHKKASLNVDELKIDGSVYSVDTLEALPAELSPEKVSSKVDSEKGVMVFYTRLNPCSNFKKCKIVDTDGEILFCSEQGYHKRKARHFQDNVALAKLRSAKTPLDCYNIGQSVKNFNAEEWERVELGEMMDINRLKFEQNADLREYLSSTGESKLGEATYNKVWGTGLHLGSKDALDTTKWFGQNKMGIVLETIRRDYIQ